MPKELAGLYTPTPEGIIELAKSKTKNHEGFVGFIVMLKSFQQLGFIFPHQRQVPHHLTDDIYGRVSKLRFLGKSKSQRDLSTS